VAWAVELLVLGKLGTPWICKDLIKYEQVEFYGNFKEDFN
jgi:hypothetical protein